MTENCIGGFHLGICPRIEIDIRKIRHNAQSLVEQCRKHHIMVAAVTKVFCAIPEITKALVEGGVEILADSRIENIKKFKEFNTSKLLLRLPMISQADDVVKHCDISLNSEIKTMQALGKAAKVHGLLHKIILMVDLGDLREGIWKDQVHETIKNIIKIDGIKLIGIGTNLTCYGGVIPDNKNLGLLSEIALYIEDTFKLTLDIISGGNSSSLYLLQKGIMPEGINNLRLGEAILLGRETAFGEPIVNTYQDNFILAAEIIEIKEKPSVPIGIIGMDAFGNKPVFEDLGLRKRAILAIGKQDVPIDGITPIDNEITIIGASSDHLIVDLTEATSTYEVGDEIKFKLSYGAVLQVMTSEYVFKQII